MSTDPQRSQSGQPRGPRRARIHLQWLRAQRLMKGDGLAILIGIIIGLIIAVVVGVLVSAGFSILIDRFDLTKSLSKVPGWIFALPTIIYVWFAVRGALRIRRSRIARLERQQKEEAYAADRAKREGRQFPGLTLRSTISVPELRTLAWSPDGTILALCTSKGVIQLLDAHTGENIRELRAGLFGKITAGAWSPDGRLLAAGGEESIVVLWDTGNWLPIHRLRHSNWVNAIAWSPDSALLATGADDHKGHIWDLSTGQEIATLQGHSDEVHEVEWSPNGTFLATMAADGDLKLWETETWQLHMRLSSYGGYITSLAWSPDGQTLVSSGSDRTIHIWNIRTGREQIRIEDHDGSIIGLSFSPDGAVLASQSIGGEASVKLWRADMPTWDPGPTFPNYPFAYAWAPLRFHPHLPILLSGGDGVNEIRIWDVNTAQILAAARPRKQYCNAKVVIVGEPTVGKTGLGRALMKIPYENTSPTHGRNVWVLDQTTKPLDGQREEQREVVLWDLAGQPGYRMVHQLNLNDVSVALVVLDSSREVEPFSDVYYWTRALRQASHAQGSSALPLKLILVAARTDLGEPFAGAHEIEKVKSELGFQQYIKTSATEGWGISDLGDAILEAIDWDSVPKVSSPKLFQDIQQFVLKEAQDERVLQRIEDLYHGFLNTQDSSDTKALYAQFDTCITLLDARGLATRFGFGNLVLLLPEVLDSYASALVNAVRDDEDGLGSISEERARSGDFRMPTAVNRLPDRLSETFLLIAMIESLLSREVVLREGPDLVFPSLVTDSHPDLSIPQGEAIVFEFEGPTDNIYATLVVRLAHSGLFKKDLMGRDTVTYIATVGGICGLRLERLGEGNARLTLFFSPETTEQTRFTFEDYVDTHLRRRYPVVARRYRIYTCSHCGEPIQQSTAQKLRDRGDRETTCQVCKHPVSLLDRKERLQVDPISRVADMDEKANEARNQAIRQSEIAGKRAAGDYDVFFSYDSRDVAEVTRIAQYMEEQGILPYIAPRDIPLGGLWPKELESAIYRCSCMAVFYGRHDLRRYQEEEFQLRWATGPNDIFPVILESYSDPNPPDFQGFLGIRQRDDLRETHLHPLERLCEAIRNHPRQPPAVDTEGPK